MTYDKDELLTTDHFYEPLLLKVNRSFVDEARAIERGAKIENHAFFGLAKRNPRALLVWASQEAIVTNPFSQLLLRAIGNIKNVHIRSLLIPVVAGEHSHLKNGIAHESHPWLIWTLCKSLGLSYEDLRPTKAVADFITALAATIDFPMQALGCLGVGNELMLLSEYAAVEECFDLMYPDAEYKKFLRANISEDEGHTALIEIAAGELTRFGYDPKEFVNGARAGVAARVAYYDSLISEIE